MLPQIHPIALPKLTVSESVQQAFFNFDHDTRFRIFNAIKTAFEKAVSVENQLQLELEQCRILVQLGASNQLILGTLKIISTADIQAIRKEFGICASGRIQLLPTPQRLCIYQKWLQINKNQQDDFEHWVSLAECFPQYSLAELYKAVQTAQSEVVRHE